MKFNSKKGQAWTSDFIFMNILLLFIVLMLVFFWNQTSLGTAARTGYSDMWMAASYASDSLVRTSGLPVSWEQLDNDSIYAIGFASSPNLLDAKKIERAQQLDASLLRSRLGLAAYTVRIALTDLSQNTTIYNFGDISSNSSNRVVITRLVMFNGSRARLQLQVEK